MRFVGTEFAMSCLGGPRKKTITIVFEDVDHGLSSLDNKIRKRWEMTPEEWCIVRDSIDEMAGTK